MFKINEEKILEDYNNLKEKERVVGLDIEKEIRAMAVSRGYSADKTEEFVKYVKDFGDNGLTDTENAKIAFIEEYLIEIPEVYVNIEETNEETNSVEEVAEINEVNEVSAVSAVSEVVLAEVAECAVVDKITDTNEVVVNAEINATNEIV